MKIGVIGAGIFGSSTAIKLSEAGFEVDLFEKEGDILQAASGINQYRLHRGYHYPRSKETGESSRLANPLFESEYGDAVVQSNKHFYCIPKEKSKVSGEVFLKFCLESELEHAKTDLPHVNKDLIDLVVEAKESLVDPHSLRSVIRNKLEKRKANLYLNRKALAEDLEAYDVVVNCTYANLNSILDKYPEAQKHYQFELCEKPVLKLPENFKQISVVIMDGPFFCIDPFSQTDLHVMGNVVHAIHATNVGLAPNIPEDFWPLLNKGVIKNPKITNIEKFIESASYFMPEIRKAEHIGSMYTVRTVLPNVDKTDERPTVVSRINDKIINVFSGKLGNCVHAAEQVVNMVKEKEPKTKVFV